MPNDPYTDDEYDDTYRKVHGDEPVRDQYTDETTDNTFFPSGVGSSLYPSGWGLWPAGDTVDADYDGTEGEYGEAGYGEEASADESEDEGWLDEGLIALLLVVGVVLFVFPEPATSAIGIGLLAVGVLAWIVDWLA